MVYFIECFTKIYTAQVDCVTPFNKAVDYLTDSINCMIATHPFLKPNCLLSVERNSPNLSIKQYSNNFDIIRLIAIPQKSSNVDVCVAAQVSQTHEWRPFCGYR